MPDAWIVVACLLGIGLMVLAGRLRQRSVERAERRRHEARRDPRLSPVQETQGTPVDTESGEGRRD